MEQTVKSEEVDKNGEPLLYLCTKLKLGALGSCHVCYILLKNMKLKEAQACIEGDIYTPLCDLNFQKHNLRGWGGNHLL